MTGNSAKRALPSTSKLYSILHRSPGLLDGPQGHVLQCGETIHHAQTSKADGSYLKEIAKLEKQDLLILDDFGLKPLDNITRHSFMEIIEDRHGKSSKIIASQLPDEACHQIIGEKTIADAILDRLLHSTHRIDIKGESMRKELRNNS